ncbi:MAG: hypothetical protein EBV69_00340 [Oxalobacteraceae bacterium]|nr:hypothetical protein [Oxalobacteraceae bacterium]
MTSIQDDLCASSVLAQSLASDQSLLQAIEAVVELCVGSLKAGGKILFAGNGSQEDHKGGVDRQSRRCDESSL